MKYHWSSWLIVGGLAIDLVDAFTTPAGAAGGVFYGSTGFLAGIDAMIPSIHVGEAVAMAGVAIHLFKKQPV